MLLPLCLLSACAGRPVFTEPESPITDELVQAVIFVESSGRPRAVSYAGAVGLMQVMPGTGRGLGFTRNDLFDPEKNVQCGRLYLEQMFNLCGSDLKCALASYNAGYGNRRKGLLYADKVLKRLQNPNI